MKWLLIEDDQNKEKQLLQFFNDTFSNATIETRRSYQSGLKAILTTQYELIILDMSMPNFDIQSGEDGYVFRHLAGRDILSEMKRKKKNNSVIVVTQFDNFGEGKEHISLEILKKNLKEEFPETYLGCVYYNASLSDWKKELTVKINQFIFKNK